jgi:hypothetical protein
VEGTKKRVEGGFVDQTVARAEGGIGKHHVDPWFWGDEFTLKTLATALGKHIVLIESQQAVAVLHYFPEDKPDSAVDMILYRSGGHFQLVVEAAQADNSTASRALFRHGSKADKPRATPQIQNTAPPGFSPRSLERMHKEGLERVNAIRDAKGLPRVNARRDPRRETEGEGLHLRREKASTNLNGRGLIRNQEKSDAKGPCCSQRGLGKRWKAFWEAFSKAMDNAADLHNASRGAY